MLIQRYEERGKTTEFGLPSMVLYDKLLGSIIYVLIEEYEKDRMYYHSHFIKEKDVIPEYV